MCFSEYKNPSLQILYPGDIMKIKSAKTVRLLIFGLIAGICNGLFGSGGGMIAVPVLEKAANLEAKNAHATAIGVVLMPTLVSIYRYRSFTTCNTVTLVSICIGGVVGSVLGAGLMKKFSSELLKKTFGIIILITAVRMVIM